MGFGGGSIAGKNCDTMQLTEEAKIRLLIDGKEASNNLEFIGAQITKAKNKLKELDRVVRSLGDQSIIMF